MTPINVAEKQVTLGDLGLFAELALARAAWVDLEQFPPGSGDRLRRDHHARRERFLAASENHGKPLAEWGLLPDDLEWIQRQSENLVGVAAQGWEGRLQETLDQVSTKPT